MKKILMLLITILLLNGCSNKENYYSYDMFYMDTYINIRIFDIKESDKDKIFKDIDNLYKEYHKLSNRYEAYDNVNNVYYLNNVLEQNREVEIDSKLYDLINLGVSYTVDTKGVINVALGNVIDVWKKYRDSKTGIPTLEELNNSGSINIDDIILDNNTYMKTSDVKIDLGFIAKGYVTELAGKKLESLGYNKYIINAGGNVKVGDHYDKSKYNIGIENPTDTSKIYKVITGNNISVVTSGGYQRFYLYNNKKYSHIIDTTTLFPPNYSYAVSIIGSNSSNCDLLSTYMFLLPIDEGIKYINKLKDVEAIWYGIDNKIYYSEGFDKYE